VTTYRSWMQKCAGQVGECCLPTTVASEAAEENATKRTRWRFFAFRSATIGTISEVLIFPQNVFRRRSPFIRPTVYGSYVAVLLSLSSAAHAQSVTEDIKAKAQRLAAPLVEARDNRLQSVATFEHQVTGVTVSPDGRMFVNFPRWSEDTPVSVAELMPDGSTKPFPDEGWNAWRNARMSEVSPNDHFVCVQSVVADRSGSLWVVDPAAPNAEKTVKGGPKVVQIDLQSNNVKRVFPIGPDVAGPASYLNDIRIAPNGRFAYLTDSGSPGGLVVLQSRFRAGMACFERRSFDPIRSERYRQN
jgi:hypothetical protein